MKKIFPIILFIIFLTPLAHSRRDRFDHRALLWWTPDKEIILAIDYYTTRADILMEIDWKKIQGDRVTLEHDLIFLVGIRQVRLLLKTYTRKKHRGLIKIGSIKNPKDEELLLQNGLNFKQGQKRKNPQKSPYDKFGLPGF